MLTISSPLGVGTSTPTGRSQTAWAAISLVSPSGVLTDMNPARRPTTGSWVSKLICKKRAPGASPAPGVRYHAVEVRTTATVAGAVVAGDGRKVSWRSGSQPG